jgi:hypothetical protein
MTRNRDPIDLVCEQWACTRRQLLGLAPCRQAREYLGPTGSTLGSIREDRDGAGQGIVSQRFPEVYVGDALHVNRAWRYLLVSHNRARHLQALVLDAYYVYGGTAKWKAAALGMSRQEFYDARDAAKVFIDGWLARIDDSLEKVSRQKISA